MAKAPAGGQGELPRRRKSPSEGRARQAKAKAPVAPQTDPAAPFATPFDANGRYRVLLAERDDAGQLRVLTERRSASDVGYAVRVYARDRREGAGEPVEQVEWAYVVADADAPPNSLDGAPQSVWMAVDKRGIAHDVLDRAIRLTATAREPGDQP